MFIKEEYNIKKKIKYPQDIAEILFKLLEKEPEHQREKEHLWIIGLDTKCNIKFLDLVSLGTSNNSLVSCKETFRLAVMKNADAIIIAHNHPTGDPTPSNQDKEITEKLEKAGDILNIEVLDHIIIGNNNFYSFDSSTIYYINEEV